MNEIVFLPFMCLDAFTITISWYVSLKKEIKRKNTKHQVVIHYNSISWHVVTIILQIYANKNSASVFSLQFSVFVVFQIFWNEIQNDSFRLYEQYSVSIWENEGNIQTNE